MSLISKNSRRDATATQLSGKKRRLALEMQSLVDEEEKTSMYLDLSYIMQNLLENPHKIKTIKMTLNGPTVKQARATMTKDESISPTYIYLPKIPKSHLITSTLPGICPKLTPEILKQLCSQDLRVDLKLLFMALGAHGGQKIMCHHKDTFDSICKDRARIMNNVLEKITWSTEGDIDWPKVGMYRLLPEVPEGDDPAEHKFLQAECLALPDSESKATCLEQATCQIGLCK